MIEINIDVVPLLPVKGIINDECVAMDVLENGILVHYITRDKALIVEWSDIVDLGLSDILRCITDAKITEAKPIHDKTLEYTE
jgi:hypothetical protein